jgi:hypothetical protein
MKKCIILNRKKENVIILILSLFFYLLIPFIQSATPKVCCEETINNTICSVTDDINQCKTGSGLGSAQSNSCDNPSLGYCKKGCCFSSETGICDSNSLEKGCLKYSGVFDGTTSNCDVSSVCNKGCCIIKGQGNWKTKELCNIDANSLGVKPEFRTDLNKSDCQKLIDFSTYGACVYSTPDGGDACTYTTRGKCENDLKGVFYNGICSNPLIFNGCIANYTTKCIKNSVFNYDNCSNPENEVKKCDILNGKICNDTATGASCIDDSCDTKWGKKKNGDEWCVIEGENASKINTPGSSHSMYYCSYGKVEIKRCDSERGEVCIVDKNNTNKARCVKNDYQKCIDYNKGPDPIVNCNKDPLCYIKKFTVPKTTVSFRACLPIYPPGFDLRNPEDTEEQDKSKICDIGRISCAVRWVDQNDWYESGHDWHCVENCNCLSGEFTKQMNNFCISLGDCGADINIGETYTEGGFGINQNAFEDFGPPQINQLDDYSSYQSELQKKTITTTLTNEELNNLIDLKIVAMGDDLSILKEDFEEYLLYVATSPTPEVGYGSFATMKMMKIITKQKEIIDLNHQKGYIFGDPSIGASFGSSHSDFWSMGSGEDTSREVSSICRPWQVPDVASNDQCDECNKNPDFPCTVYKCHTLGKTCEFINEGKGTDYEKCVDVPSLDVTSPIISALDSARSDGYEYVPNPAGNGYGLKKSGNCIDIYNDNVTFGIKTDKEAICKFSLNMNQNYSSMTYVFGKLEVLRKEHIEKLDLGRFNEITGGNSSIDLTKETNIDLYIKCMGINKQENYGADYVIDICIKPVPRRIPPRIDEFIPETGSYIPYGNDSLNLTIYLDYPSNCKWGTSEESYDKMTNVMTCNTNELDIKWPCTTKLTEINETKTFYISCEDTSENKNKMDPNEYTVQVTKTPLTINETIPKEGYSKTIGTEYIPLDIKVDVRGGIEDQRPNCTYLLDNKYSDYLDYISGFYKENIPQVGGGSHELKISCMDNVGNSVEKIITFTINIDKIAPIITRVYFTQGGSLIIMTNENAECKYSFNSETDFKNMTSMSNNNLVHSTSASLKTYYIKCKDEYGNEGNKFKVKGYK